MTLIDFLSQYQTTLQEIEDAEERLKELLYPTRGNRIIRGEHSGISNQPEEYAILKDKLERKIEGLKRKLPHQKKQIERFLSHVPPRKAKILRKKYIEGLNTLELASWMHVQPKSALAALRLATESVEIDYLKLFYPEEYARLKEQKEAPTI